MGLQSEETDTKRGTPANIEEPEGIKCELNKAQFFNVEIGFVTRVVFYSTKKNPKKRNKG